jgi:hypothetical protein
MDLAVVPLAESHIEGFRAVIDSVARERRFLAMLEAPPIEEVGNSSRRPSPQASR